MNLLRLSLIVASATALPGGAKEKIMERLNKYNFDVACWGRQNVWDMIRAQEAAMTTCSGAYPTSLPAVIPQARLYQPLQVTGKINAQKSNESIRFFFFSKLFLPLQVQIMMLPRCPTASPAPSSRWPTPTGALACPTMISLTVTH